MTKYQNILPFLICAMQRHVVKSLCFSASTRQSQRTWLRLYDSRLGHMTIRATSVTVYAKKRRRKAEASNEDNDLSSDLPDFDMNESGDGDDAAEALHPVTDGEVPENQKGSPNIPTRSVKDLIADRQLERKFEFDDAGNESLPDLAELVRAQPGRKKQKQAQRQAAAQQRNNKESQTEELLSKIPFITDDKGKITPIKVIEAGTWLGIFLLIAWEVYINTPFFDRVAPMAPVVY